MHIRRSFDRSILIKLYYIFCHLRSIFSHRNTVQPGHGGGSAGRIGSKSSSALWFWSSLGRQLYSIRHGHNTRRPRSHAEVHKLGSVLLVFDGLFQKQKATHLIKQSNRKETLPRIPADSPRQIQPPRRGGKAGRKGRKRRSKAQASLRKLTR